ncbi:hypothetical protein HYW76_04985 [Candidatus Pacearchaeota archaeon]|nr:hypothetical protein [Candidatus Pacearchaeota archaeon]
MALNIERLEERVHLASFTFRDEDGDLIKISGKFDVFDIEGDRVNSGESGVEIGNIISSSSSLTLQDMGGGNGIIELHGTISRAKSVSFKGNVSSENARVYNTDKLTKVSVSGRLDGNLSLESEVSIGTASFGDVAGRVSIYGDVKSVSSKGRLAGEFYGEVGKLKAISVENLNVVGGVSSFSADYAKNCVVGRNGATLKSISVDDIQDSLFFGASVPKFTADSVSNSQLVAASSIGTVSIKISANNFYISGGGYSVGEDREFWTADDTQEIGVGCTAKSVTIYNPNNVQIGISVFSLDGNFGNSDDRRVGYGELKKLTIKGGLTGYNGISAEKIGKVDIPGFKGSYTGRIEFPGIAIDSPPEAEFPPI